jgi:hypothetical protein
MSDINNDDAWGIFNNKDQLKTYLCDQIETQLWAKFDPGFDLISLPSFFHVTPPTASSTKSA